MMMLSQAANAIDGTMIGSDILFTNVSKDTREMPMGALYVALKGLNFDGHDFIEQARQAGAVAALVSDKQNTDLPQVKVDDTLKALGRLAAVWRDTFDGRLIGITGSNGKTTVKEMCHCILAKKYGDDKVMYTQGNLNNDIGMTMTLLSIRQQHEVAVIEMGANHICEIKYLTAIARPDVAIITNAGAAHIEGFGSLENIAKAKAEIFEGLTDTGVAIINDDDDYSEYWKTQNSARRVLTFSMKSDDADVTAKIITGNTFSLKTDAAEVQLTLQVPGKHNVMNALAAATASLAVGVDLETIGAALETYSGVKGRLQCLQTANGTRVIDDTYNANPYSLQAAIDVLVASDNESWLVLGDMGELGSEAKSLHREAGVAAKSSGVDRLFAIGELSRNAVEGFGEGALMFSDKQELITTLRQQMNESVTILVKGSRYMKMEEIVSALVSKSDNTNPIVEQVRS